MKPVVIVGGGLAGLSAAVALSARKVPVILLEQKPALGGRAYSFHEKRADESVDNGQHLLIAGYDRTMAFLTAIGSASFVKIQSHPLLVFHHPAKGFHEFSVPLLPPPLNLIAAALGCSLLTFADRLRLLRAGFAIRRDDMRNLEGITIRDWLDSHGQTDELRRCFWDPLAVAIMNEMPERASASLFVAAMRKAFLSSPRAAALAFPSVGLSEIFGDPARRFIESHGGSVRCGIMVKRIEMDRNGVTAVGLRSGRNVATGACILAVPPFHAAAILPRSLRNVITGAPPTEDASSPIVSVHLWFKRDFMGEPFVGLIGRRVQWLFNRRRIARSQRSDGYICAVISAAYAYVGLENKEIIHIALEDVRSVYGDSVGEPIRSLVIKEKKATISLTPGKLSDRPGPNTAIQNLFLAGDWTDTGYPATLEGAIVSGERASASVLSLHDYR